MDLNTAVERAMPALEEGGWEAFVKSVKEEMGQWVGPLGREWGN